jgi:hypothetical protein
MHRTIRAQFRAHCVARALAAIIATVACCVLLGSCSPSDNTTLTSESADSTITVIRPSDGLTFSKDVAPIVLEHCAACHRPDGAAPFGLLTYADVKKRAAQIAEVTRRRYMPPWLPEDGDHAFANNTRLSDDQIATIENWFKQGSPEGDPADMPPAPESTAGWPLGEPDLVVKAPVAYTLPAETTDVWRNLVIPTSVTQTRYIRAVEIRPGNKKIVHHAILRIDRTGAARKRDADDHEPGFDGMDRIAGVQNPDGHFLGWTPGRAPFPGYPGLAWRLEPGVDLVLQLHIVPSGKPEQIQPVIGLYFADEPPRRYPFEVYLHSEEIEIPPGARDHKVSDSYDLPVDVKVLGVYPHAHLLAKSILATAVLPDGTRQTLLRIDDWDFNWQNDYRYAEPVSLPRGTTVSMELTFDNSDDNPRNPHRPPKPVRFGLRTTDEMAQLSLQVLTADERERAALAEDFRKRELLATIKRNEFELRFAPRDVSLLNELGKARFVAEQIPAALEAFQRIVDVEPANAEAHYYLGRIHSFNGDHSAAIAELQTALAHDPKFYQSYNELGLALMNRGDLGAAADAFEQSLKIQPDDAPVLNNLGIVRFKQDRPREAMEQFRKAIKSDPSYRPAADNLRRVVPLVGPRQ